jgi:spore germination protein YaaH
MKRLLLLIGIPVFLVSLLVAGFFFYLGRITPQDILVSPLGEWISKPEIIGFQPYWLVASGKKNYASDITTLTYFGLRMEQDGTIRKEDRPGEAEPGWRMLNSDRYAATLSAHRVSKTKLSLLVQNMVEEEILTFIKEPETTAKTLVSEIAPIMRKHGFTDLNLDIESFNKASDSARMGYTRFVQAVKNELVAGQLGTLTVELTPKSPIEMHLIDVARIGQIADYVVLMAYDYHYVYSSTAGAVAPVSGVPQTAEYDVETALKETLRYVPPAKVILGVPLYGYEWETLSSDPGAPVIPGSWQVATGSRVVPYAASCTDCTTGFDPISQEPYVIFPGERPGHFQQVFYENKEALQAKINLAKKYQIAGVAMWALGYESEGMLDPFALYKKSVHYRGFRPTSTPDYTLIPPATFVMQPPTDALVGSILIQSGEVMKFGRLDEEYQPMPLAAPVLQGESYMTGTNGTISFLFDQRGEITMEQSSELSFLSLLPPVTLLRQKKGTVHYVITDTKSPWTLRVLHAIVAMHTGSIDVTSTGSIARVTVISGRAVIGAIDPDNKTSVYTLSAGQSASISQIRQSISVME